MATANDEEDRDTILTAGLPVTCVAAGHFYVEQVRNYVVTLMSNNNILSKYRAKRDFSKTAEPSGQTKIAASNRRRFIIQKHAATRLHYDLRLELDGVFKSWAVTRGPSLDPRAQAEDRNAAALPHASG